MQVFSGLGGSWQRELENQAAIERPHYHSGAFSYCDSLLLTCFFIVLRMPFR